jgi:hypothetical protein
MLRKTLPTVALLALVTPLAACDKPSVNVEANGTTVQINGDTPTDGGYKLEVSGDDTRKVVRVTAPDGKTAASEVKAGVSALMADADAATFLADQAAKVPPASGEDKVNISVPGFSMQVSGDDKGGDGSVKMNIAGSTVNVQGNDDKGIVSIAGVGPDEARKFIDRQDGLSDETRAQMKAKLGL